jgi:hypothetical protein
VLLVAAGLVCCGFGALLLAALSRGAGGWRSLRLTMLLPLGLLLLWQGLWRVFGREEWSVSDDLLEVRRTLLGFRRTRRFRGATLRLTASGPGAASRAQRRLLRAARAGGRSQHGPPTWVGLSASDGHGQRRLAGSAPGSMRPEELRSLGELLSERTGWPLRLPAGRGKR